jgi:hypothetical protein
MEADKSLADKFIDEVIESAYWQMPKEYRQFDFQDLDKGEQFEIAVERIGFERFKSLLDGYLEKVKDCYIY